MEICTELQLLPVIMETAKNAVMYPENQMEQPSITTPVEQQVRNTLAVKYFSFGDLTVIFFYFLVETRIYEKGILQGLAVKQTQDGECEERNYTDGKLEGEATIIFADNSKEIRNYHHNKPNGQAMLFGANGDRIEFNYENGVVTGKATIKGSNGDKEACLYVKGVKHGPATYFWKAGHR